MTDRVKYSLLRLQLGFRNRLLTSCLRGERKGNARIDHIPRLVAKNTYETRRSVILFHPEQTQMRYQDNLNIEADLFRSLFVSFFALLMYKVNCLGHIGTVRNPNKTFSWQTEP